MLDRALRGDDISKQWARLNEHTSPEPLEPALIEFEQDREAEEIAVILAAMR